MRPEGRAQAVDVADIERSSRRWRRSRREERLGRRQEPAQEPRGRAQGLIFGQDDAIEQLVRRHQARRAGLRAGEKPIGSFLFAGPTGVGKTELAKQLAKVLGVEFSAST
jgi:ATP-dependent Clp protease ATP-binding subunit ClpA